MVAQDETATADLRDRIMAALSDGQRRSAHPADRRMLRDQAGVIALAIQEDFAVFARQDSGGDARSLGILLPAES